MDDQDFLEQLDACRAGGDDLRDELFVPLVEELAANPQRRALRDTVQQIDTAVVDAMEDVPLPAGLQQRLLAALTAAEPIVASAPSAAEPLSAPENRGESPGEVSPAQPERISRRRMLWTTLSTATAASVATAAWLGREYWFDEQLTPAIVLNEAIAFHAQETPQTVERSSPPRAMSPAIASGVRTMGWRRVEGFLGRPELDGIAFELMHRGTQATLYIVQAKVESLKSWPLRRPDNTTAGRCVSAWQGKDSLYVLVVSGGPQAYRGFVADSGVV